MGVCKEVERFDHYGKYSNIKYNVRRRYNKKRREEVINMPNKNGKGPKGRGPRDGHGGGKGKGTIKPAGAKKGGKKGGC